jgi:hypothetical protein
MRGTLTDLARNALAPYVLTLTGETDIETASTAPSATVIPLTTDVLLLDPGGAGRTVVLQAAPSDYGGLEVTIQNTADAAEDLTIEYPENTTILTISQSETGKVLSTGSAWINAGLAKAT